MTKILITGGAGFLGSYLTVEALRRGFDAVLVDNFNYETVSVDHKKQNVALIKKQSANFKSKFTEYVADITNYEDFKAIMFKERPEIIIHAASLVMDRLSMHLPDAFIRTNVIGSQNLINIAAELSGVKHMVFISSRSAIGEKAERDSKIFESDLFRPINPYGASKAAAEGFFYCYHHNTNVNVSITRMQPLYGPRCRHDMLPWRVINSILTQEQIEKYGTGDAVRDWLFIDDAVDAIFKVVDHPNNFQIFNIGTGKSTTTNGVIAICENIAGKKANVRTVSDVQGDAYFAGIADCTKIREELNWRHKVDIEEGLSKTYAFMKSQLSNY